MTIAKNKVMQFGVLLLVAAFVFQAGFAQAASNTTQMADAKDVCADRESADDEQDVVDDNTASDENDAEDICEKAESAKLATQVKVSETKARQIAEANHSSNGKITELILARDEDERNVSRVVYEIEFTESNGTQVDVKVDANTGVYLGVDTEDDNDGEDPSDDAVQVNASTQTADLQMKLISLLQQLISLLKA